MMPRWSRFVGPVALLLALILLVASWAATPRPPVPPQVGVPFPTLALAAVGGAPRLTDADLRRGHVTLVNIFASWCIPCRAEAPQLAALRRSGIALSGIAVRDTAADAARFVAGGDFDRLGLDLHDEVQAALGTDGIPETYVVDGDGVVRARFRGGLHADDLAMVRAAVAAAQ